MTDYKKRIKWRRHAEEMVNDEKERSNGHDMVGDIVKPFETRKTLKLCPRWRLQGST